ncbi:zinc finger protein 829-like isoform X1 [Anastrepha obliqua]|uniref:zinc finger protein 829-like isoform X1 n=1 Tax=Anastrepha obliqua TaxID=95512 RepID=UPI00240A53FD|nr:zinc finger protein 829-like isoform X1 [Anastrepha obliqua]
MEESDKQKIQSDDLKKCGEITTLLSVGKKEFFLNCGLCDYTFIKLENFISHMCEDHIVYFTGPKIEESQLSLDFQEEMDDGDIHTQSPYSVEESDDSNSNLRDFERVEIELDDSKMSESLDVKEVFVDRFMSEESEESLTDNNVPNNRDAELSEIVDNSDDDVEFTTCLKALGLGKMFDKNMILAIFANYEKRPVLWDADLQLPRYNRKKEKEIKSIAEEVGIPTEWDTIRKLIGKLSTRLRTEMVRKKIYNSKGKTYSPAWYSDLNTFLKPRRQNVRAEPKPKPKKFTAPESILNEEQCVILAGIYKACPSLWDETDITYRFSNRRREALKNMYDEFIKKTGLSLTQSDLDLEISRLRKICSFEKRQKLMCKRQNLVYKPRCQYYEHLAYLEVDVTPYECAICGKLLAGPSQYKVHLASHDGSLPFKCHVCGHGFKLTTNLTVHLRRHVQDYMYSCKICNKTCATTTDLKAHMRYHTGEKPYVCEICGKKFRSLSEFRVHMQRHEKRPRHKCEICSKTFYRKSLVTEHMSVHIKIRDKICNICNKGFTSSKHLRQHKQIHADEKRYECKICGKRFAQYAGLSGHVKSHGTTLIEISSKSVGLVKENN